MPFVASAQEEGTKAGRELRAAYDKSLQGKTIAYLPIALGVPLSDEWGRVVQEEAEWRGMKYVVRDPNNNPSAMQQALTALVDQKPDVLIVQNPSVTLLMKDLKRAESQGTHVIQVNMASNYKSGAFVGAVVFTRPEPCIYEYVVTITHNGSVVDREPPKKINTCL